MPSLSLFGQRTPVAGDDLRIYSFLTFLLRLAQLGASLVLLINTAQVLGNQDSFIHFVNGTHSLPVYTPLLEQLEDGLEACLSTYDRSEATHERFLRMNYAYLVLSLFLAVTGVLWTLAIGQVSGCGTPTNGQITVPIGRRPDRQRHAVLQGLCHVHLTLFAAFRLAAAVMGFSLFSSLTVRCSCVLDEVVVERTIDSWNEEHPEVTPAVLDDDMTNYGCGGAPNELYYFLTCSHIVDFAMNAVAITYISSQACCSTKTWRRISNNLWIPRIFGSEALWQLFCHCCCTLAGVASCFLLGGVEAALGDFTDIAMLLSDYFDFHGTLDITATDIVMALLLLGEVQTQRAHSARRQLLAKTLEYKSGLLSNVSDDDSDLEEAPVRRRSNYSVVREESADSLGEGKSMRQVIRMVKRSHNFDGIHYRLKRYDGAEWNWEAHVTKILDPEDATDLLTIAEGARFMKLAMAIYTWVMYAFNRPCTGLCTIVCVSTKIELMKQREHKYDGDGICCSFHSTAFLREAGILDETEVLYATFVSGVVEAPHAIVLDHEWKSVVITIRGTLSLEDVLTDLTIKPINLGDVGRKYGFDGSDFYVHAGMLATCEWILKGFEENKVLEKVFGTGSPYAHYRLRVTGHSLGAGVASILSMMLRPRFPDLKCHSFSPPGCTMSEDAAAACEEFITSYVLNADFVCRGSLNSLDNLRHDLVDIISRIKVSKNSVMAEFTGCSLAKKGDRSAILDRLLYDEKEIPQSKFTEAWKEYRSKYDAKKMERGSHVIELFPPGKIVQIFPSSEENDDIPDGGGSCFGCRRPHTFLTRWASRLDFREIRISKHFVDDHIPINVLTRLEEEAERFGLAPPYLVVVEGEHPQRECDCERPRVTNVKSIMTGFANEIVGKEGIEIRFGFDAQA